MAKAKTITTRTRKAPVQPTAQKDPFPFVRILDKASDVRRGIKALENAADGAFLDHDGSESIGWMLEHLEREHEELRGLLRDFHEAYRKATGEAGVAHV
jgi:hypothetical protein